MNNKKHLSLLPSLKKQQGMSMWSLLVTVGVVIFFAYITLQLVPVYTQNETVKSAMTVGFDRAENIRTLNRNQYINTVQKQLFLDEAHRDIPFKDLIKFKRNKKGYIATLKYERVVPLFFNISLKVDFDQKVEKSF